MTPAQIEQLSFSGRLKAFRHGTSVGRAGQFKRDQLHLTAAMIRERAPEGEVDFY